MGRMTAREKILAEMAGITAMLRGSVSAQRRTRAGREYYSLQRWKDGRNDARYVPADKVAEVREAVRNHRRFMRLLERCVALCEKNVDF